MRKHPDEYMSGNLTAMIDVVFQLIIFFVATVSLQDTVSDERIRLAMAPSGRPCINMILPSMSPSHLPFTVIIKRPSVWALNTLKKTGRNKAVITAINTTFQKTRSLPL